MSSLGKSTTISMLTGLTPLSSGDAVVRGRKVSCDVDAIRRSVGYCPQHDVLWAELTCTEHLELFAALKVRSIFVRSFVRSFVRPFVRSCVRSFVRLCVRSLSSNRSVYKIAPSEVAWRIVTTTAQNV